MRCPFLYQVALKVRRIAVTFSKAFPALSMARLMHKARKAPLKANRPIHRFTPASSALPCAACKLLPPPAPSLALPTHSSVACGGHGGYGGGMFSFSGWWEDVEVLSDVTDQLVVRESWVRKALPAPKPVTAKVSANMSTTAKPAPVKPAPIQYANVRVLTLSGPEGAEVTIERSFKGGAWELADVFTLSGSSAVWKEPRCNAKCPRYEYRCTATMYVNQSYFYGGGGG